MNVSVKNYRTLTFNFLLYDVKIDRSKTIGTIFATTYL